MLARPHSRDEENVLATENAVAALGKALAYHADVLNGPTGAMFGK